MKCSYFTRLYIESSKAYCFLFFSQEIREGGKDLIEKIRTYKPKIAVFNGKGIYEIFSKEMFGQKKKDFSFGRQPNTIPGTNTVSTVFLI